VRALVGGKDYNKSQFNRATQGAANHRAPPFKLFVYLAALKEGMRQGNRLGRQKKRCFAGYCPKELR